MARRALLVMLAAALSLIISAPGISGGMGKEGKRAGTAVDKQTIRGTVTRLEGNTVTIRDGECQERTVRAAEPKELRNIRVGDHVAAREGRFAKADVGPLTGYGIRPLPFPGEAC